MRAPAILVVTGVSGVGKTAAVSALETRGYRDVRCHYSDNIELGLPDLDAATRQAHATTFWIRRLATGSGDGVDVLDLQTRPSFVRSVLKEMRDVRVSIVLLDCAADVRSTRLAQRGQAGFATPQLEAWSAYLRGQADALELPTLDTSRMSAAEVASALEEQVELLRHGLGLT